MPRLVISPQYNPYLNIAVENYLLSQPVDGEVTFYLWQNRRTVVIGQNQNPYAECDVALLEQEGGYVMRRRTGGGAVYHDLGNINFSFIVANDLYNLRRQFSVIQRAVESYGLHTELSGRNDILVECPIQTSASHSSPKLGREMPVAFRAEPCAQEGQRSVSFRKFSGNAFSKGQRQRLHHGTILIRTDVADLQRYLRVRPAKLQKHGVASVQSRVVNLSELVPGITAQNIVPHMVDAFTVEYGAPVETIPFNDIADRAEVKDLAAQFASPDWKYGRWRNFEAQRSAQFEWGGVDLAVEVDESTATITHVDIATDSLDTAVIDRVRTLLSGASTLTPPPIPANLSDAEKDIVHDILSLVY